MEICALYITTIIAALKLSIFMTIAAPRKLGALYITIIIAASRIYWVDLDISTKMDHFMTVFALFLSIFGLFSVFELYLNSTRPILVTSLNRI